MKLRKPCPHGWYDPHALPGKRIHTTCPGGVFLPDDELIGVLSRCANGDMTYEEFRTWADQWLAEPDKNQLGMW